MELRNRGKVSAEANRLIATNDALSTSEQDLVLQYLAENNDTTNRVFLVVAALLQGIVGTVYLFLFISRDRTFAFLMEPMFPLFVIRSLMLVCALVLLAAAIWTARFCRSVRMHFSLSDWVDLTRRERDVLAAQELKALDAKFGPQAKAHAIAACVSLLPAAVFVAEVCMSVDWSVLDLIAASWQPLLHFGMYEVMWWLRDSQGGVIQLLSTAYVHEKA